MDEHTTQNLDHLLEAVLASSKYRYVDSDFIRSIGAGELGKRRNLKEAIKTTKNKLHQVGGAYQQDEPRYARWLDELRRATRREERAQVLAVCKDIMSRHASTRERLPMLEDFYSTVLAEIAPVRSVIDIACGLHPLAIPWMPLAENARYYAYDIYSDMMAFLTEYLKLMHLQGHTQACDVIQYCPQQKVDVAFILKAIPCLEQVDK